ncbi:alpha/beta fold hydrolase [Saccharothrix sp. Mg75]|uniref:alpha/beta fold hydrolase n=1 Tax=Saccharothrix sp. Mg75 TaxID=3445357 RepID=UPI003EEB09B7
MRPIIRAFGGLGTVVALVLGTAAFASAEERRPVDAQGVAAIEWAPCPEIAEVECGTLSLPIDWAKPRGERFDLAVARRKALDPDRRLGVLVINPGGPGGSGVDFALGADDYFSPEVRQRFDIIGFDPRGVARSQPVKCSFDLAVNAPSPYPTDQAGFDALAAHNRELAADCRARSGPIYDHADTLSVVKDVDALRKSLGERKINYYGISYGTLIGQQYAEEFGRNTRSMVIDSNMDHSLGTWRFNETEAVTAEDSFTEFVKWCGRTESCALHGRDVPAFWDGLLARADRGEVTDPDDPTYVVSARDVIRVAFSAFYGPDWAPLAEFLVRLAAGEPTPGVSLRAVRPAAAQETVENPFPAVFCQDWAMRVKDYREFSALVAHADRLAPHMRGGSLGHSAIAACVGLPGKVANPQHRLRIEDSPKILMSNALHDPATAYEWAVNANRQSRDKTVLLTYEGWGHGVYDRSACTRDAADRYLISLKTPRPGARCAAVEPPGQTAVSLGATPLPTGPAPGVPGWLR